MMQQIVKCSPKDYITLVGIWERSVRATHTFLDETAIKEIRAALIPEYFPQVELYASSHDNLLTGFIGLRGDSIEMLFVDGDYRGRGYGTRLIEFAKRKGATSRRQRTESFGTGFLPCQRILYYWPRRNG